MTPETYLDAIRNREDNAPTPRPVIEAQRMELLSRFDAYAQPSLLKVRDLVREKRGLGMFKKDSRANVVMIVWRLLDPSDHQDRLLVKKWIKRLNIMRLDCVVAYVDDDGVALTFMLHELAQLEPWTEDASA